MIKLFITFWQALRKTIGIMILSSLAIILLSVPALLGVIVDHIIFKYQLLAFIFSLFYIIFFAIYLIGGRPNRLSRIVEFLLGD